MSRLWKKRCAFQTPLCASLVMAFVGLYFCALRGQLWIGIATLALSLLPILWIHGVYEREGGFTPSDRYALWLLSAFWGLLTLSLLLFGLRTLLSGGKRSVGIGALVAALVFGALLILELLYLKRVQSKFPFAKKTRRELLALLPIGILCLLLVLLNLKIFETWLRWDSYDYYYYINRLSYTSLTNLETLRLANHAAYGCSLLYILVNGITGNPLISVYAVNLLMLVAGSFLFWRLTVKRFPHWKPLSHLLVTCVYAFSPFTFGLVYSISLETFLMFGMLLFFWGEAERLPLCQVLGALLICFGKETGAVLLCCIMAVRLALHFFGKEQKKLPLHQRLSLSLTAPVLCLGLVWLYDLVSFSWLSSNSASIPIQSGTRFNSFDFNFTYIKSRLISLLFSNFTWLILLVVLAGFLVGLLRKRRITRKEQKEFLAEYAAGAFALLVSSLLFVTYNHIRYVAPLVFLLILFLPDALDRLFSGVKLRSAVCGVLVLCSLVQCYFTVDPLMYVFFNRLDKGNGSVIYTDNDILHGGSFVNSVCVNTQYNREIMYFDRAFDELLAEIGYNTSTCLVVSSEYRVPSIGGYVFSEYLIMGFGYPYMEHARYVTWDAERETRYLSDRPEESIRVGYVSRGEEIGWLTEQHSRCVYIQFPFRDQTFEDNLLNGFTRTKIGEGSSNGWTLVAYELT